MKNKEIEEVLNELKEYASGGMSGLYPSEDTVKNFVSYIEQLESNYKEANESITWWQNRYNAIVKQNDDNHKNVVKLENNRDKAINFLKHIRESFSKNDEMHELLSIAINLLKGDSDENK